MKKSFILLSILVFTIAGLLLSCDLFSLDEWFDFATKAIITTEDTGEVKIGDTITLNGNTSECGMNETLTYSWEITQKPAGSTVALETPTSKQSSLIPDYAGIYNIRLTVEDDDEDSDSCEYTLEVSAVITASAETGGSINPSGGVSVTHGNVKTFTITSEAGYEISDVLVDGTSVGAVSNYTFTDVIENHTISATFALVEYVITATAGTGGSISSSGDVSVTHGNDKTFTITPETGYEISDVLVDGTSVGAVSNYTFTDVIENHTISATFSLVDYVITASAGTGGSINPSGDVSVTHGSDKTFTITPETGYEISDVLVDGTSVGAVTSHTFDDVTENHTISVTFSLVEYVITATAGTGGSISPSGDVSITHGSDKTFTITPETGYEVSDVQVDDVSIGAVTSHTFNDVIETHTISATFAQSEFTITFDKNSTDATGTMSPESVTSGDTISLPMVGFSRSGYTFSGWATSSGGAVVYGDQASFTMDSTDVTLYAVWQSTVQYMVSFDKNDSAATGTMLSQWITQGQTENLDPNRYSLEGCSFVGWAMTSSGSIAYVDQAPFTMGSNHVPLYALWEINDYTITFEKNDELAEGEMEDQTITYDETANLNSNCFTNPGMRFIGWSTTPAGEVEYSDQASYSMAASNVVLYAIWDANEYTIIFNKNSSEATGEMNNQIIASRDAEYMVLNSFCNPGWVFQGWATSSDGDVAFLDGALFYMGYTDVNLFAIWDYFDYEIGDTGPAGGKIFYDDESDGVDDIENIRYLEAAPFGWYNGGNDPGFQWSQNNTDIPISYNTQIGSGKSNTQSIVDDLSAGNSAAKICYNLSLSDYEDWFLPSRDELQIMMKNKNFISGLIGTGSVDWYWSSSQGGYDNAWFIASQDGIIARTNKVHSYAIRPVRGF